MRDWAKFDIRCKPGAVLVAVQTGAAPGILPRIVGGGIGHVVVFLFVLGSGIAVRTVFLVRTSPVLLVKPDGDFFFDRLALYWNVDRHLLPLPFFVLFFHCDT